MGRTMQIVTLNVYEKTRKELFELKEEWHMNSIDEVLQYLIHGVEQCK